MRDFLQENGIKFITEGDRHCREGWFQMDCPFCGTIGKYHLGYNIAFRYFNCWACGSHGVVQTLRALTGKRFDEIVSAIPDMEKHVFRKREKQNRKLDYPKDAIREFTKNHFRYLLERNICKKSDLESFVKKWNLSAFCNSPKRLAWRIFIPIFFRGQMVSWTTRSVSNHSQKPYIVASENQEIVHHKHVLFGEQFCENTIVICEGIFDAWRIGNGAVATLGTGYTRKQLLLMKKYPKRIVCFDNEKIAQKRAEKLCLELQLFPGETFNVCLDANDPGSASEKEIKKLRRFCGVS